MRNVALMLGALSAAACSVDHLVVAALDAPSAGRSAGGESGAAGAGANANANTNGGSLATSGGSAGQGGNVDTTDGAGAAGDGSQALAGDGGASSRKFCACLSNEASFCGSDGITYPTTCEDGGPCFPPAIDCWHACPCLDNEPQGGVTTSIFPSDCAPVTPCSGDKVCWMLTDEAAAQQPSCPPSGN